MLLKYWYVLKDDPKLNGTFNKESLVTYKRASNIRNRVVKACSTKKLSQSTLTGQVSLGNFKCGNCVNCEFTRIFFFYHNKSPILIKSFITCKTNNVIYIIRCPCNKMHVGETSRSLKERITEHRSAINRKDPKSPVARHFCECNHNMSSFFFLGIEKINQNSRGGNIDCIRKKREAFGLFLFEKFVSKRYEWGFLP